MLNVEQVKAEKSFKPVCQSASQSASQSAVQQEEFRFDGQHYSTVARKQFFIRYSAARLRTDGCCVVHQRSENLIVNFVLLEDEIHIPLRAIDLVPIVKAVSREVWTFE